MGAWGDKKLMSLYVIPDETLQDVPLQMQKGRQADGAETAVTPPAGKYANQLRFRLTSHLRHVSFFHL